MATSLQHTLGGSRLIFKDRDWLFIDTTHFVRSDSIFNTDPCQAQSHNFWFAFNVQWWSCASSLPPQSCLANYFVCVCFLFWFSIPVSIYPSPNFFTFVEEEKTRHLVSSLKLFQISFCICLFSCTSVPTSVSASFFLSRFPFAFVRGLRIPHNQLSVPRPPQVLLLTTLEYTFIFSFISFSPSNDKTEYYWHISLHVFLVLVNPIEQKLWI